MNAAQPIDMDDLAALSAPEKLLRVEIPNALAACADPLAMLQALKAGAVELAPHVRFGGIEFADAQDGLLVLAETRGLFDDLTPDTVEIAISQGLKTPPFPEAEAEALPPDWMDEGSTPPAAQNQAPPLEVSSAASLAGDDAPPRRWLVPDRVPMAAHTLLSGDGAAGKTTILLQLCHATVRGADWLGSVIEEPGPAIFLTAEEDRDEIHRRLAAINANTSTSFADLADLHFISLPGEDAVLAKTSPDGIVRPTLVYRQLEAAALRIRPKLIAIEAAADVYAGNENSRPEVRQFSQILRRLAIVADAAVILVQHPSVSGLSEGNGRSGSTGWRNSFRSQLHFAGLRKGSDEDEATAGDLRTLTVGKSNYGPAGESVTVRWQRGVFVPEGSVPSLDRMAAEADVDAAFVRLLETTIAQGRRVSPSPSVTYAPAVFEKMPGANGVKKRALAAAMERLLAAGKIVVATDGRGNKERSRLAMANR